MVEEFCGHRWWEINYWRDYRGILGLGSNKNKIIDLKLLRTGRVLWRSKKSGVPLVRWHNGVEGYVLSDQLAEVVDGKPRFEFLDPE